MATSTYQPRAYGPLGGLNQTNKATAGASPSKQQTTFPPLTPQPPKSPQQNAPSQKSVSSGSSSDRLRPEGLSASGQNSTGIKYNVEQFRYPEYTGSEQYLKHYMVFFINVRGKSKFNTSERVQEVTALGQNRLTQQQLTQAGVEGAGLGLGAVVGGFAASKITQNLSKTSILGSGLRLLGTGGGAVLGAVTAEALNEVTGAFEPDKSFRISTAVMLAVNEKPSVSYGINYDGRDLGTMMGFLAGGTSAVDGTAGSNYSEATRSMLLNVANIPAGIANLIGTNFDIAASISAGTAMAPNPFREQVFRNVETRQFVFDYKFLPRSKTEAENVLRIIKQFKFHMHPEISPGGLFYIYPSTFDIAYYFDGSENTAIHRISTCVLENMNVDYGGGSFNTFHDGIPTEINMKLRFRELEVMTKERIDKGF